jgi:hypothetical protein
MTVTGNTQLAAINFTGLADWGTSTAATVTISGNNLTATSFKDAYDATPATSDTGAFDAGTSGMKTLKPYLAAVLTSSTSAIAVYFDVVETLTEQLTSATTAYTDVAGHVDAVSGDVRNAYAYQTAFVADTTPTIKETHGYVQAVGLNTLYANADLTTGEGMKITLGGVAKQWIKGTPATVTSVATLISAINAETAWGNGYTVTAAQDSYSRSYNKLNYTDEDGAVETLASTFAGKILVSLGGVTSVISTLGLVSTTGDMATAIAAAVSGTAVNGVGYHAAASGSAVVLSRYITNTFLLDDGKFTGSYPSLAIETGNVTYTTEDFSDNTATTNQTGVNSDFFISFAQTNTNGLRVSVQNNSTSIALVAADVVTNVGGDTGRTLAGGGTFATASAPTALVSGTNMTGDTSIDATFAEVSSPGSGTAAVTRNRTGW